MNAVLNLHEIPEFFIFFGFRALFDRYVSYFMYVASFTRVRLLRSHSSQ